MKRCQILSVCCVVGMLLLSSSAPAAGGRQPQDEERTWPPAGDAAGETTYLPILLRPAEFEDLAFLSDRDGKTEIYTMRADGTHLKRLTYNSLAETGLAWSPDGTMLAFEDEDSSGIYVLAPGQEVAGNLAEGLTGNFSGISWSPDSRKIAFTRRAAGGESGIVVANVDGSGMARWPGSETYAYPSWSPDGDRIAYVSDANLFTRNPDGSQAAQLTDFETTGMPCQLMWSPDSTQILFAMITYHPLSPGLRPTPPEPYFHIYRVNRDGSGLTLVKANDWQPVQWAPDSRAILAVNVVHSPYFSNPLHLYLLGWQPTQERCIACSLDWVTGASWSRQVTRLLVSASKDAAYPDVHNAEIYLVDLDSGGYTNLTRHPAADDGAQWRP